MKQRGFLQDSSGNNSSSRLLGFIVTMYALALCTAIIVIGCVQGQAIMLVAAAAGTTFASISGPALAFMFGNKKSEVYRDINTTEQSGQ